MKRSARTESSRATKKYTFKQTEGTSTIQLREIKHQRGFVLLSIQKPYGVPYPVRYSKQDFQKLLSDISVFYEASCLPLVLRSVERINSNQETLRDRILTSLFYCTPVSKSDEEPEDCEEDAIDLIQKADALAIKIESGNAGFLVHSYKEELWVEKHNLEDYDSIAIRYITISHQPVFSVGFVKEKPWKITISEKSYLVENGYVTYYLGTNGVRDIEMTTHDFFDMIMCGCRQLGLDFPVITNSNMNRKNFFWRDQYEEAWSYMLNSMLNSDEFFLNSPILEHFMHKSWRSRK